MKKYKYLFCMLGIESVLLLIYYSIFFINNEMNSYKIFSALFVIVWVILATIIVYEAYIENDLINPMVIYLFSLTIFIFFVLFMDSSSSELFKYYPYRYKNTENLIKSMSMIILSTISFYLPQKYIKFNKTNLKRYNSINDVMDNKKSLMIINIILLILVISIDFYSSKQAYGSVFGRITESYASGTKISTFSLLVYLYPMVIINFYYIYLKFKFSLKEKLCIIPICFIIIAINFLGGSRALIFSAIMGIVALYYKAKGIRKKALINVGIIVIVIYSSFVFIQSYRVNKEVNTEVSYKWQYDTLDIALLVTDRYPEIENFTYGGSIKSLILNPIPRKYYANKPRAFGSHLGKVTNPQDPNTASSYAAVTPIEFYANFGLIGMLIFMFIVSCILQKLYITFGKTNKIGISTLVYINFIVGLYMSFRGDFTTKTIHLFLPIIIFEVVKYILYVCANIKHPSKIK